MSMTLVQFRDIVIANTGIEGDRNFPSTRLNLYVNKATKFVQQKLNGLGYKKWEKSSTLSIGAISTSAKNAAGTNYAVGDLIYVSANGNKDAVLVVLTLSGSAVATYAVANAGTGYAIVTGAATTSSGSGTGFTLNITAVTTTLSSGTLGSITVKYGTVPSDLMESPNSLILLDCVGATNNGTTKKEYNVGEFEDACGNSYTAPTEKQPAYTRLANKIYLFPSTITSATVYYYGSIADLVNDSDTSNIPTEFEEYVIKKVVAEIQAAQGVIKDLNAADQAIAQSITDTFNKFLSSTQERQQAPTQRHTQVVQ